MWLVLRTYRKGLTMKTIAFIAQKGGTGKTASTAAIGEGLRRLGKTVLFIDLDPQGNLSTQLEAATDAVTITDVLTGKRKLTAAIQTTAHGDIVAADSFLAGDDIFTGRRPEYRLRDALTPVKGDYDVCLIDCPPSLSMLTISALTAADGAIIPCKADRFSLYALQEIDSTIQAVKGNLNKSLKIYGVLVTMFQSRATIHKIGLEELQEQAASMGISVYAPPIRAAVAVQEAQLGGSVYDTRNNAADDYKAVTLAILKQLEGDKP